MPCSTHSDNIIDPGCKSCLVQHASLEFRESKRGNVVNTIGLKPRDIPATQLVERAHGLHCFTHVTLSTHPRAPFVCVAGTASGLIRAFSIRAAWSAEGAVRIAKFQPLSDGDVLQRLAVISANSKT